MILKVKFTIDKSTNQVVTNLVHSIIFCTITRYETIMEEKKIKKYTSCCDVNGIFKIIGGKWKALIIKSISSDCPKRFRELRREMENMAQTTLTIQLRELERDGIICRKIYAETPPRVEYKLSEVGKTLLPILDLLDQWWIEYKTNQNDE